MRVAMLNNAEHDIAQTCASKVELNAFRFRDDLRVKPASKNILN